MKRFQTFHETLIPLLVEAIGAEKYLELGTSLNATLSRVRCRYRYGVDIQSIICPGVEMFPMTTKEFIKVHAPRLAPFDFVFIDADHSEAAVRADFFGIINYVRPEGIVCLHDTNPETVADAVPGLCNDSWKFARSLYLSGYECVTLPYHPGLSMVRNRKTWGPTK